MSEFSDAVAKAESTDEDREPSRSSRDSEGASSDRDRWESRRSSVSNEERYSRSPSQERFRKPQRDESEASDTQRNRWKPATPSPESIDSGNGRRYRDSRAHNYRSDDTDYSADHYRRDDDYRKRNSRYRSYRDRNQSRSRSIDRYRRRGYPPRHHRRDYRYTPSRSRSRSRSRSYKRRNERPTDDDRRWQGGGRESGSASPLPQSEGSLSIHSPVQSPAHASHSPSRSHSRTPQQESAASDSVYSNERSPVSVSRSISGGRNVVRSRSRSRNRSGGKPKAPQPLPPPPRRDSKSKSKSNSRSGHGGRSRHRRRSDSPSSNDSESPSPVAHPPTMSKGSPSFTWMKTSEIKQKVMKTQNHSKPINNQSKPDKKINPNLATALANIEKRFKSSKRKSEIERLTKIKGPRVSDKARIYAALTGHYRADDITKLSIFQKNMLTCNRCTNPNFDISHLFKNLNNIHFKLTWLDFSQSPPLERNELVSFMDLINIRSAHKDISQCDRLWKLLTHGHKNLFWSLAIFYSHMRGTAVSEFNALFEKHIDALSQYGAQTYIHQCTDKQIHPTQISPVNKQSTPDANTDMDLDSDNSKKSVKFELKSSPKQNDSTKLKVAVSNGKEKNVSKTVIAHDYD